MLCKIFSYDQFIIKSIIYHKKDDSISDTRSLKVVLLSEKHGVLIVSALLYILDQVIQV